MFFFRIYVGIKSCLFFRAYFSNTYCYDNHCVNKETRTIGHIPGFSLVDRKILSSDWSKMTIAGMTGVFLFVKNRVDHGIFDSFWKEKSGRENLIWYPI